MPEQHASLRERVAAELPFLRRYARAITGSQTLGDAAVREMLEGIIADPDLLGADGASRVNLFRLFHQIWNPLQTVNLADGVISHLPVSTREAMLLTMVEGFSTAQCATILDSTEDQIRANIANARIQLEGQLHASVMIIEDEAIIAMHLRKIVQGLGNTVAGVARTRDEAVAMALDVQPDLILADISLADGSSGIDAVTDILGEFSVPVIFITAFPERLLTGERPEPTYLITKPFEPETVTATIWQALLVHRERQPGLAALQWRAAASKAQA